MGFYLIAAGVGLMLVDAVATGLAVGALGVLAELVVDYCYRRA